MFTKKEFIIFALIIAIVCSIGSAFIAKKIYKCDAYQSASVDLQPGLKAAYDRLVARGHADIVARGYGFRESKEIRGEIREVSDKALTLSVKPVNPLADQNLDTRNIKITKETRIYKREEKSREEFEKDMEEFEASMKNLENDSTAELPLPPDSYKKVEIKISELKQGDRVKIVADDFIHDLKEFAAREIIKEF